MAGDWIKFEKSTMDKPEVIEMADILGIDPDAVIGKLLRVWSWFDSHSADGNAPVTLEALLNRITNISGFCDAMEKVGWLEKTHGHLHVRNYDRHNGKSAKSRGQTKNRVESLRSCNASSVTKALPEKRREEILERDIKCAGESEPSAQAGTRRPSLGQALAMGAIIGVSAVTADEWWHTREASNWIKGAAGGGVTPVGDNHQADLKIFASRASQGHFSGQGKTPDKKPIEKLDWKPDWE